MNILNTTQSINPSINISTKVKPANHQDDTIRAKENADLSELRVVDKDGNNFLHTAISNQSDPAIVMLLIDKLGASYLGMQNKAGYTPLHLALVNNTNPEIILKMIYEMHPADLSKATVAGYTPIFFALVGNRDPDVGNRDPEILKQLIEKTEYIGLSAQCDEYTPLQVAMLLKHDPEIIKLLIGNLQAVDLNVRDAEGRTPFSLALLQRSNLEIIKLLIANIDRTELIKLKALDSAIDHEQSPEVIKCIIDKLETEDLNIRNEKGYAPLHRVLYSNHDPLEKQEIMRLLLEKGADPKITTSNGMNLALLAKLMDVELPASAKSDDDEEFYLRYLLANIWSLKANTTIRGKTVNLELGGTNEIGPRLVHQYFKQFDKFLKNSHLISHSLEPALEAKMAGTVNLKKEKPEDVLRWFYEGKFLNFTSAVKAHAIQVIIDGNYLFICNRGAGRKKPSIVAVRIDRNNAQLDEDDIKKLQGKITLGEDVAFKYFYEELPAKLASKTKTEDLFCKIFNEKMSHRNQKIGNCWWVSPKMQIIPILSMLRKDSVTTKTYSSPREERKALEKLFKDVNDFYKEYTKYVRAAVLKEYLDAPAGSISKDHQLVKSVVHKWKKTERKKYDSPAMDKMEKVLKKTIHEYTDTHHLDEYFNPKSSQYSLVKAMRNFDLKKSKSDRKFFMELISASKPSDFLQTDLNGNNPLHLAIKKKVDPEIFKVLINSTPKSGLTQQNKETSTPLFLAISNKSKPEIIEMLINRLEPSDLGRYTFFNLAALLKDPKYYRGLVLLTQKLNPADLSLTDTAGNTALHYAININSMELINLLIAKGADIKQTNKSGESCLQLAAKRGIDLTKAPRQRGA